MFQTEHLQEKWSPVLQHHDLPEIKDSYMRAVTTILLEKPRKGSKRRQKLLNRNSSNIICWW
jgi:hypothetical protein